MHGKDLAGLLALGWMTCARRSALGRGIRPPRQPDWLATASWFIPVANLWLPAVAVVDLVRPSDPDLMASGAGAHGSRLEGRVWGWWAAWSAGWVAFWLAFVTLVLSGSVAGCACSFCCARHS